jgi:hypothetical protein
MRLHQGWEGKLWTEANLPALVNDAQFRQARSFAQMADIARYELVHAYGGVYLDTDMECMTDIEPIVGDLSAFAAWLEPDEIGTGIFGATAGHPWLSAIIAQLPQNMAAGHGILHETGPRLFTEVTRPRGDVQVFAMPGFYEGPYACHHSARSWHEQQAAETAAQFAKIGLELDAKVPPGASFICVDDDIGGARYSQRSSLSILVQDGEHIGAPVDSAEAVARVRRLQALGANFIAFIGPASWWLEHYQGLRLYLDLSANCIVSSNQLSLFRLGRESCR